MSAARMPGADERAFRTITGQRIEPSAPWPLPSPTEQMLQRAADKAAPRRFTGEAITGFGDDAAMRFEEDLESAAWAAMATGAAS